MQSEKTKVSAAPDLSPNILYQDQNILVLNKPAGVVVNRADTVSEPTVQDWAEQQLPVWLSENKHWSALVPEHFSDQYGSPESIFSERVGVVHRLDKETSGALVLAKNPGALVFLLTEFRERRVVKHYTALCHGKFGVLKDSIDLPLGRAAQNRLQFAVRPDGREARTEYEVETYYPHLKIDEILLLPAAKGSNFRKKMKSYQGFSLVHCWPKTGRTHQIRVHLAHLKHPLVGDAVYVGKKRAQLDKIWCGRHFLHASQLTFLHPQTRKLITIDAPLPADLQTTISFLVRD